MVDAYNLHVPQNKYQKNSLGSEISAQYNSKAEVWICWRDS